MYGKGEGRQGWVTQALTVGTFVTGLGGHNCTSPVRLLVCVYTMVTDQVHIPLL